MPDWVQVLLTAALGGVIGGAVVQFLHNLERDRVVLRDEGGDDDA